MKKSRKFSRTRTAPVKVDQQDLVDAKPLLSDRTLPLLITPRREEVELIDWVEANRDVIGRHLLEYGGVLFRGFGFTRPERLTELVVALSGEPLEYRERSSPRTEVQGKVYTSTEHPADQHIFLHNENSYQKTWPMKLFFMCAIAAERGGETPIADCRAILKRLGPELVARFEERGFQIVRNYGDRGGMGLPWTSVFRTEDREQVNAYCAANGIEPVWKDDGGLRTITRRPAIVTHPVTGEKVWFNHGTFFHVTTLAEGLARTLQDHMADEDLPTNTYYGDGEAIEPEIMERLRAAYREEMTVFPWEVGDVMILDNMLSSHGRMPFEGDRRILVAMSEPMDHGKLATLSKESSTVG